MSESNTAAIDDLERIAQFAVPNAEGGFDSADMELIDAPPGLSAWLMLVMREGGWASGAIATLPDGEYRNPPIACSGICGTRSDAIISACEDLIYWCSEEKERGGKKHKRQAEALQAWALGIEKGETAAMSPEEIASRMLAVDVATDEATGTADDAIPAAVVDAIREHLDAQRATLHTSPIAGVAPRMFPLARLRQSPLNPRKIMSASGLEQLTASMKNEGFRAWSPLVARLLPDDYGVLARGHRRYVAAQRAGLVEVPVILAEMSDAQYEDILTFDNTGGEDVHPLHDALSWRAWLDAGRGTVEDIAARVGQSASFVYKRLKCCELIEAGQRLWLDGFIDEGHAVEIARRTLSLQRDAVQFCTPPAYDPEQRVSILKLRAWIRDHCNLSLSRAPFSPADETLPILQGTLMDAMAPVVGSCIECPKRSGASPHLFSDIEDPNVCTDPACYRNKAQVAEERKPKPVVEPYYAPSPKAAKAKPEPAPAPEPDPFAFRDRAEEDRTAREARDAESQRLRLAEERREKVYLAAVDAILAKVEWPISAQDFAAFVACLIAPLDCAKELADKFKLPQVEDHRWRDIERAAPKLAPQKLARVAVGGLLLDIGYQEGFANSKLLEQFAKRYGVYLGKLGKAIDEEISGRTSLRGLNPPAEASPKSVIAKLGTLDTPKASSSRPAPLRPDGTKLYSEGGGRFEERAPAASSPAVPPAKDAAKKAPAKKAAAKPKVAAGKKSAPAKGKGKAKK